MKRRFLKFVFFLLVSCSILPKSYGQNLTGIWRGYFITDIGEQYKFELQLAQSPKKGVSGVSYSYLTTRFYGKATLTGNFNTTSQLALIQEIRTVEVRMSSGSIACIMKCLLNYEKSGNEEFLEGTYTSKYENSDKDSVIKIGGSCGGGKVFLRKVITSDFYVEPFLRDKPTVKKTTPQNQTTKTTVTTKPPVNKPLVKTTPKTNTSKTTTKATVKPPANKPVVTKKQKEDSIKKNTTVSIITNE